MTDPITIALGGRTFLVRPLTLRQLRNILPAFARAADFSDERGFDGALDIIAAAVSRDAPDVTRDGLLDLEASPAELAGALAAIARLSGLVSQGEAPAAASTGAASTVS